MSSTISPLAGKPLDPGLLVDLARLGQAYFERPDPADPAQRVAFGTSGHRGSSLLRSFNEAHILAIAQAICLYRRAQGIDGPLVDRGFTAVPDAPGLGVTLDEEVLRAHLKDGRLFEPTPEWNDERSWDRLWS